MDPDEVLEESLEICRKIDKAEDPIDEDEVDRLAELILELHSWIKSGGYLPSVWESERTDA
jgi:hypothetical protein